MQFILQKKRTMQELTSLTQPVFIQIAKKNYEDYKRVLAGDVLV